MSGKGIKRPALSAPILMETEAYERKINPGGASQVMYKTKTKTFVVGNLYPGRQDWERQLSKEGYTTTSSPYDAHHTRVVATKKSRG